MRPHAHHIRPPHPQQWGEAKRRGGRGAFAAAAASAPGCRHDRFGPGNRPRIAAIGEPLHGERRDRCAQRGDGRGIARENFQQVVEDLRVALLDVADDLLDLARRRPRGVVQRDGNLRPARVRCVLRERAATDDRERERTHRRQQSPQHSRALSQRETIEARGDNEGQRRGGIGGGDGGSFPALSTGDGSRRSRALSHVRSPWFCVEKVFRDVGGRDASGER